MIIIPRARRWFTISGLQWILAPSMIKTECVPGYTLICFTCLLHVAKPLQRSRNLCRLNVPGVVKKSTRPLNPKNNTDMRSPRVNSAFLKRLFYFYFNLLAESDVSSRSWTQGSSFYSTIQNQFAKPHAKPHFAKPHFCGVLGINSRVFQTACQTPY